MSEIKSRLSAMKKGGINHEENIIFSFNNHAICGES